MMAMRIRSMLCAASVSAVLILSGCALFEPTADTTGAPLSLQRPDEQQLLSRSGRFVLRANRTERQPSDSGAQGQFEWLELRSQPNKARQMLLLLNPLGQSGPSLERELTLENADKPSGEMKWQPDAVRIFDEQGQPLSRNEQRLLLARLIGPSAMEQMSDTQMIALLASVMNLFQMTAAEDERNHQRIYSSDAIELSVRIAFDAAPAASELTGAASR